LGFWDFIGEITAIIHWFANIFALAQWANLTSAYGFMGGTILSIIISLITGSIAEYIESRVPTILRPFKKLIRAILELRF
jgi:hypothetical protein